MRSLLFVCGAILLFASLSFAQGESPEVCTQCVCVADNGCTYVEGTCDGTTTTDCSSESFVASCSADFHLRVLLSCVSGTAYCKYCFACVRLYDGTTLIGSTHTSCLEDDCDYIEQSMYALTFGHTYTLVTCLRSCASDEEYCEQCDCVARGYAYINWNDCSTIPACNP